MRYAVMANRVIINGKWRTVDNLIPTFYIDADSEKEATLKAKAVLGQCDEAHVSVAPCERDTTVRDAAQTLTVELDKLHGIQSGSRIRKLATTLEGVTAMREAVMRIQKVV